MTKTQIMANINQSTVTRSKLIANNTVKYTFKNGIQIIQLYETDIIIFHTDGMIELNTGGYYTRTTKNRLNRFQPFHIYQKENYEWYVERENLPFYDGIKLNHDIVYGAKFDANPDKGK